MHHKSQQIPTKSTIECCHHCVPPKRHTACWDHCPEYLKEKADYEAKKAAADKKQNIKAGIYCQRANSFSKTNRKHGRR